LFTEVFVQTTNQFKQIGRLLMQFESVCTCSCYDHTLELLQVRVTIFAKVFGVSAVANDQYTSLKLAKKRKKNNLLKTKIILKPKYKPSGGSFFTFNPCQRRETCPSPPVSYTPATNTL